MFERRFRLAVRTQGANQQQGFSFAHRLQNDGVDGVAPQLQERGDALMAVDHQIALFVGNDDDGCLLAGLSQGR